MVGHCPKCKTRWTNGVKDTVVNGQRAKLFTCPKCGHTATQRVREGATDAAIDIATDVAIDIATDSGDCGSVSCD